MLIKFALEGVTGLAPLTATLPQETAIYNEWPPKHLRVKLPKYHRVATVVPDQSIGNNFTIPEYDGHVFMSPPIHVRDGDVLSVSVRNSLQTTGLSLHWHGFEMTGHLELDGVVGITQCPISPGDAFTYEWQVEETPGTYWYHTHSGELGIDAYNAIMGPLIVHPVASDVPFLDPDMYDNDPYAQQQMSMEDLLFYGDERILFFKDGFLHAGEHKNLEMTGGLNPPISYNDDRFSVGTYPWNFGTCNGKMREVVPASPGQTLKFRLFNAGSMFALRISFDGLRMTIVAADSEPVEPVAADEVILHGAERFDVEITIPEDAVIGSTSWIRADTLESRDQGYQNGIRAILHIVDPSNTDPLDSNVVPDPDAPIKTDVDHKTKLTYNCYSYMETKDKIGDGGCLPVSALRLKVDGTSLAAKTAAETVQTPFEAHVIDWQFSASPQFVHFVRIDGGKWNQHAMSKSQSMLLPGYDAKTMLHSNAAVLNVDAGVRAILIWRNKSSMDHPIHLHSRKMEILEELIVKKSENCDLVKCQLSDIFSKEEEIQRLAAIPAGRPLKDTFILPAGGVVATRIFTGDPALWFGHCHLESHREDGMAMMLRVGDYQAPSDGSWLPSDYPKCNTTFLMSKKEFPACDCYINADAVMQNALTKEHRCSRDYLCFHEESPQSTLEYHPYESNGIGIRSQYLLPPWAISLIIVLIFATASYLIAYRKKLLRSCKSRRGEIKMESMGSVITESSGIALVIINMQNEYVDKQGKLYGVVKEGIEDNNAIVKIDELVKFAREKGAAVIHVKTVLEEGDASDEFKPYKSSDDGIFRAGTWNAEIFPEIYNEGDVVFETKTPNGFTSDLKEYVENNSITKLLLCGFTLDLNVAQTDMAASEQLGLETEILIIEDCSVASSIKSRQESLYKKQPLGLISKRINQNKAKAILGGHFLTSEQSLGSRRDTVKLSVERHIPLTLDLPSQGQDTRRTRRSSVGLFQGRTSEKYPIAAQDFTVPKRRTQMNIEIEGFKVTGNVEIQMEDTGIDEQSPFQDQFMFLFNSQWLLYRPTCISLLRMTEVTSLAFFTGGLFYTIGEDTTATGFGSINSLLFFSVTLWTFTRMYPAINTYFSWNESLRVIANEHRYSLLPACLARSCVVFLAESGWPFIYVFVCYPLASMAGSWNAMFKIGSMLALNNICYISIGSILGIVVDKVPKGMIVSTIVAQSSLVAAGFYTAVPEFLGWMRYLSPVFWTYRGIVKSAFTWSDTFNCRWGSTLAGVNSCFVEFHTSINNLKNRGINVATFGDEQSTQIWLECIVLVLFYVAMQSFIFGLSLVRQKQEDSWEVFFERLAEYQAVFGETKVPLDYRVSDIQLGLWCHLQRKKIQAGKLTDEQVERLEELGFYGGN